MRLFKYALVIAILSSCKDRDKTVLDEKTDDVSYDTTKPGSVKDSVPFLKDTVDIASNKNLSITTISRRELVDYAKTLIGVPYKYASTDPAIGFDCSGFITYVFNHFNITVPKSSVDFTNVGTEVSKKDAKEGDLILFTGTVDSIRVVGHMGIVTENIDTLRFIHSTSGRANGVTISALNDHYEKRFVKVVRVFEE